jgi:uncharacterized protein YeaO (DUF488 family)
MAIRVIRLGEPRKPGEGLWLGTVRRPPRGVRKQDYGAIISTCGCPISRPAGSWCPSRSLSRLRRNAGYVRAKISPPGAPARSARLIALVAALSSRADFSVGCYCANETQCHRSLLRELLVEAGAQVV